MRNCKECGNVFEPKRKWQAFCSDKCRNNWHWKRIKDTKVEQAVADKEGK